MEVVDVIPEHVNVLTKYSLEELIKLNRALNMCTIQFDGKIPEQREAHDYFMEKFCPTVAAAVKDLTGE